MPSNKSKPQTKSTKQKKAKLNPKDKLDIKTESKKNLSSVWSLSYKSCLSLWRQRNLFIGILIIYGLLDIVFVKGFSGGISVANLNSQVSYLFHGINKQFYSNLTVYGLILASAGTNSIANGGAYLESLILVVIISLATIWSLRISSEQTYQKVKNAFYKGMYPLVPFIMILLLIGVELLPMLGGIYLYTIASVNHIITSAAGNIIFIVIAILLTLLSFYFVSSSIFALYISTLPDTTPLEALRTAKELVSKKRAFIFIRLVFLFFVLLIITSLILFPLIIASSSLTQWVYLFLTLVYLLYIHSFLYNLYLELVETNQLSTAKNHN